MPSELRVDKVSSTTSPYTPVFSTTGGALSHRNMVINGAMQVAQRGTTSTSSGYQTVDRFRPEFSEIAQTQSQESLTSGAPYDLGFRNYLRLENTSVSSSSTAYSRHFYKFEAQDIANSGWNYTSSSSAITVSFWVRSSLAGTYYSNMRSLDGTFQNFTFSTTLSADTWTKVTKTIYGDSNITIDNDNGTGLELHIWPYLGTNYTTSSHVLDTWHTYSSSDQTPDYSQNWANTSGATFDLTGVQLERGTVATPFEHRSYADELRSCERYYESMGNFVGLTNNTPTSIDGVSSFRTTKRTSSYTVGKKGGANISVAHPTITGHSATAVTASHKYKNYFFGTLAVGHTGHGRQLITLYQADDTLYVDDEL